MKRLKYLFIHCSATPEGIDIKGEAIAAYHTRPKPDGRGWSRPGYRLVIELDGSICRLIDGVNDNAWVESGEITNGAKGYNHNSHHICYVGGVDKNGVPKDTRTDAQREAMRSIVNWYLMNVPKIKVMGHNEVAAKACPSFNVHEWLKELKPNQLNNTRTT